MSDRAEVSRSELADLRERLNKADEELARLADRAAAAHAQYEYARLDGKRQGVRLALSYIDEATRG